MSYLRDLYRSLKGSPQHARHVVTYWMTREGYWMFTSTIILDPRVRAILAKTAEELEALNPPAVHPDDH